MAPVFPSHDCYYLDNENPEAIEDTFTEVLILLVFIIAFIGGFLAPYNVRKTAKYGAWTYTIMAGIPIIISLYAAGELTDDPNGDIGTVFLFILLITISIVLGISIVVVAVLLFVGGTIGSLFGKMIFIFRHLCLQTPDEGGSV